MIINYPNKMFKKEKGRDKQKKEKKTSLEKIDKIIKEISFVEKEIKCLKLS